MVADGTVQPATKSAQQVNLFDICLQAAADVCESGHALLIAGAVRLCVTAVAQASEGSGAHILSLHHILASLCTGYDFFEHHREEALGSDSAARRVSAAAASSSSSLAANASHSPPDTPRLLVSQHPSTTSLGTTASQQDRDLLDSRNAVLKAGGQAFADVCRRAARETVWWSAPGMHERIAQFERVVTLVNNCSAPRLDVACELMLALNQVDGLKTEAPRAREVFFCLAWLTVYSSGDLHSTTALREFLTQASKDLGEFPAFGYGVRRLVMPMVLDKLATCDPRKFSEAKELLLCVWMGFRMHLKAELAVATPGRAGAHWHADGPQPLHHCGIVLEL